MLKTMAERTKFMPRLPRSIVCIEIPRKKNVRFFLSRQTVFSNLLLIIMFLHLGKSTGLSTKVEIQIEIVQMEENVFRDFSYGMLGNLGEYRVSQLVQTACSAPSYSIWGIERK